MNLVTCLSLFVCESGFTSNLTMRTQVQGTIAATTVVTSNISTDADDSMMIQFRNSDYLLFAFLQFKFGAQPPTVYKASGSAGVCSILPCTDEVCQHNTSNSVRVPSYKDHITYPVCGMCTNKRRVNATY